MSETKVVPEEPKNDPVDKRKFVFLAFAFLGSCSLLPWNFFITATTYFQFRLRTNKSETVLDFNHLNQKQILYPNQMAIFSMIPLALTNMINLLIKDKINGSLRIFIGNMMLLLMFVLTVILVGVDISDEAFLGLTFFSIVIINIGSALFQGSFMGILSMLPGNYIGIFLQGQAVAGILTALISILLAPFNITEIEKGALFFSVPIFFSLMAYVFYFAINKSNFYLYYLRKNNFEPSFLTMKKISESRKRKKKNENQSLLNESSNNESNNTPANMIKNFLKAMKEVVYTGLGAFFCLCFTLAVFPALLVNVKPMHYDKSDPWTQTYFLLVVVFLSFNVNDYIGRFLASNIKFPPVRSRKTLLGLILSRIAFVVLVLFLNQADKSHIPTLFVHDAWLIILVILLGLTNGYLLNLCFMYAPQHCSPGNQESAGVAMSIYMSLGLGAGVSLSFILKAIL